MRVGLAIMAQKLTFEEHITFPLILLKESHEILFYKHVGLIALFKNYLKLNLNFTVLPLDISLSISKEL